MTRASATVDLAAIRANVRRLKSAAPQAQFMAVVKADGYGHGMLPVAHAARQAGAQWLGVALPSEAVRLRQAGDTGHILAWLFTPDDDLETAVELDVHLSASADWALNRIINAGRATGRIPAVHLKVDTGLGRSGAAPADWPALTATAARAQDEGLLRAVGIWSHLACADEPDSPVTSQQVEAFEDALEVASQSGVQPQFRHLANSAGTLAWPNTHYDVVRCGIAVYGLTPGLQLGTSAELDLAPAMSVRAQIAHVKQVPAGHGVSYGHRYHTSAPTTLALVPVGYADGVPRAGSGRLPIGLSGQQFTVAGTVAMDQVVLDVGDLAVAAGDEVVLFGDPRFGPSADDWASACDTINYEIVTRLGSRVPRVHQEG